MDAGKRNEEAIFYATMEIDSPRERSAFVKSACGEDAELLRRVEGLLKFHYDDDRFLKSPPAGTDITLDNSPLTEEPGTKIGRYKLLQLIGEGGHGSGPGYRDTSCFSFHDLFLIVHYCCIA